MNRSDVGLLAVAPALLAAAVVAARTVGRWDAVALLGVAAAVAPVLGLVRAEVAVLTWLPGLFLAGVLFAVAGISLNALPGPLGGLTGGWAIGAPLFAGLALAEARARLGARVLLASIALLAAAAAFSVASAGAVPDASAYALAFVQVPKEQALAVASVLAGGASTGSPFLAVPIVPFYPLALLAGAGVVASLVAVDATEDPEGLGHEGPAPQVPEGEYRSLLAEGRQRLEEATPAERPAGADGGVLVSVIAAAVAALAVVEAAIDQPSRLVPGVAVATIALLTASLFAIRYHRPAPLEPTGPAAPARPTPAPEPARKEPV